MIADHGCFFVGGLLGLFEPPEGPGLEPLDAGDLSAALLVVDHGDTASCRLPRSLCKASMPAPRSRAGRAATAAREPPLDIITRIATTKVRRNLSNAMMTLTTADSGLRSLYTMDSSMCSACVCV